MISLHWFRRDLRLHDNPALLASCAGAKACLPVYVLEPQDTLASHANRAAFLSASLLDLDASLRRCGSSLLILRGNAATVLPEFIRRHGVRRVTFEKHVEPSAIATATAVAEALAVSGDAVEVRAVHGHTLWDPEELLGRCPGRRPPIAYKSFCQLAGRFPVPAQPLPAPTSIPVDERAAFAHESAAEALAATIPSIAGTGASIAAFPGGESEALRRLQAAVASRPSWVSRFEKPETSPASLAPSTTALSPYLSHGCLSPRTFLHAVNAACRAAASATGGGHTQPPVSLEGQLMWRDFYHLSALGTPGYSRMAGNPICKQVDWDADAALVAAWEQGRTGYPWIDAIMTQLRTEGWIHHLARHSAACFLTRGDLYQSWEVGAAVFERELLDYDWA